MAKFEMDTDFIRTLAENGFRSGLIETVGRKRFRSVDDIFGPIELERIQNARDLVQLKLSPIGQLPVGAGFLE